MKELGEALKAIFDKIGDFFDILDLSFFISGAAGFGAFTFWGYLYGMEWPKALTGGVGILAVLITCYLFGLFCFALGRLIGKVSRFNMKGENFGKRFCEILTAHGLIEQEPFKGYMARKESNGAWRLYVRLWAEIRQTPALSASMSLIRRYWVMAATYDGLSAAILMWIVVLIAWQFGSSSTPPPGRWIFILNVSLSIIMVVICLREAGRYVEYQMEELVATISSERSRR